MKAYLLVDCNNFYVSCERVFAPSLAEKPVIILSNNDGCVVARSNEVKALNIKRGTPFFQIAPLVKKHQIRVFSSNYTLYADLSQRIMQILEKFTPQLEVYSIDEAFLLVSGLEAKTLCQLAGKIKATIERWTGVPVTVGIGPSKTLAKMAATIAKAGDGIYSLVENPQLEAKLAAFPVSAIWGIGKQYTKRLHSYGIRTALQLRDAPDWWVQKELTIMGLRTVRELRGIPCFPLEEVPPPKQGIVSSRSFGKPITSQKELKEAVASYAARAGEKLRSQKSVCSHLTVFISTSPFRGPQYANAASLSLPLATANTQELIAYALSALSTIYKEGFSYQKAGVFVTEIESSENLQLNLFASPQVQARNLQLTKTLDQINHRWGKDTIHYGAQGIQQNWKLRREFLSPRYTTRWDELPVVKA